MGKMKKYTDIILGMIYGCIIGVANIIPGVSGGTIAVMLNIYDKLIDSFTGIRKNFKKSMAFLVPVILGAVIGIVAFSVLIKYLINNHPLPTCFFFIGLILGSLPLVCKRALETKFKIWSVIPFIIFLAGMTALAFVSTEGKDTAGALMEMNAGTWFYMLLSSVVAAMCMIIPGVSGSMIFMIFGVYSTIIGAISGVTKHFMQSCMTLMPVGIGVVIGIVFGAKIIDICIKRFPQMTYFAIIGLMLGSPLVIFMKFQAESAGLAKADPNFTSNFVFSPLNITVSVIVFAVGLAIALFFGSEKIKAKFAKKNKERS